MEDSSCLCSGLRFCSSCRNSLRVQKIFRKDIHLLDAEEVIRNQRSDDRTSSCSIATIGASEHHFCPECSRVFLSTEAVINCSDHKGKAQSTISLSGLFVVSDILSKEEEMDLVKFFDNPSPFEPWKLSQSGRRKQEYGPKKNFKKKKVKPSDTATMPSIFRDLFKRVSSETSNLTGGAPFSIAEASILEYTEDHLSNIDPHVDDTWLWGNRIAGVNLLENCTITFVNSDAIPVEAALPRRSFFLMSNECRYDWMHGIRPENVKGRRISITMRELSDEIMGDQVTADAILRAASNFVD